MKKKMGSRQVMALVLCWLCATLQIGMVFVNGLEPWLWVPLWLIWSLCLTDTFFTRVRNL